MLDVETTLTLTWVFDHIGAAEARAGQDQDLIQARDALARLLTQEGASTAAIALHKAEMALDLLVRERVGAGDALYNELFRAIRAGEKARFTRTIEKAFGDGSDDLLVLVETTTGHLFSAAEAQSFTRKAKDILERHHGFAKEP